MSLRNYFNNNAGLFAGVALFSFLMVETLKSHIILSFVSYYFVVLLLIYITWNAKLDVKEPIWKFFLFLGYVLFFLSLLEFGYEYNSILLKLPEIILYFPTMIFMFALLRRIYKTIKGN
ncbi:MAG: hypothetical protein AABX79_00780 [Nanoarchaeota archaeon]